MMSDDFLSEAKGYVDNAIRDNDLFEVYKLLCIVSQSCLRTGFAYYNSMEITRELMSKRLPYIIKGYYSATNLLMRVCEIIQENDLKGSVGVEYEMRNEHIIYCSDQNTAMILALHL